MIILMQRLWVIFLTAFIIFSLIVDYAYCQTQKVKQEDIKPKPESNVSKEENPETIKMESNGPLHIGSKMFFDADISEFTKDGNIQVFRGDVVAIGGGVLLTADKIEFNKQTDSLTASGHVVILTQNQVFIGDRLSYQQSTGDFLLVNSSMIVNDSTEATNVSNKLLGFSAAEIEFESRRQRRLNYLQQRKEELRNKFRKEAELGAEKPSRQLIDQYSLLLEQEKLTSSQENPSLSKMADARRKRFKARRYFWQKGLADVKKFAALKRTTAFFKIKGDTLTRKNLNDYFAENAFWTSCKTSTDDEHPAWGFRCSSLKAQLGGYLDLYNPVLEIKGVPVLYLPYLKLPIKSIRQSGFLMPVFTYKSSSGNIYSQPLFLNFSSTADSTFTFEMHEKRGFKLGTEFRYQPKQYSGLTLNIEAMRDKAWMKNISERKDILNYWISDCGPQNTDCIKSVTKLLPYPENKWRDMKKWEALSIIAPRLSFVTNGLIYSDHRYEEDLYVLNSFEAILSESSSALYFAPSQFRLHLDAKNFYAGIGSSFADNVLTNYKFQGQQIPGYFVLQTRMYSLDRGKIPVPIYGWANAEYINIMDVYPEKWEDGSLSGVNKTLGSGSWSRLKFREISPFYSTGIIKVDQFSEFELRSITHNKMSSNSSSLSTWLTGITLNLPIDGYGKLPEFLQDEDIEHKKDKKYIHHSMNWSLTFSARPDVSRTGDYGKYKVFVGDSEQPGDLVYFASDRPVYSSSANDISSDDTMVESKKIAFSTSHSWQKIIRGWNLIPAAKISKDSKSAESTEKDSSKKLPKKAIDNAFADQALNELLYSVDRPVTNIDEIYDEDSGSWLINRYQLIDKEIKGLLSLGFSISYDFDLSKKREEAIKKYNESGKEYSELNLPQPWSEISLGAGTNIFGMSLGFSGSYNKYYNKFVKRSIAFSIPTFYSTRLVASYEQADSASYDQESKDIIWANTTTRRIILNTRFIPYSKLFIDISGRTVEAVNSDNKLPMQFESKLGYSYYASSGCWALQISRVKKFAAEEKDASYQLALYYIFMGISRSLPGDLAAPILREIPGATTD